MAKFKITKNENTRYDLVNWDNPGFGKYFSDHVFLAEYKNGKWNEGEIIPYGPMQIEPAMTTLHYGQTIFEGMKAYHAEDGGVNLFRPERNAWRLNHSAEMLCIPKIDEKLFLDGLKELVAVDRKFIPTKPGQALYIRPLVFGDGNFLGVQSSETFKLIIMTSPVGSYYAEGMKPVRIKVADELVRAVRGGLGAAKTAANYAASLYGSEQAKKEGFAQVLWLDGVSRELVDEVGAMNIMFVIDGELITPPLSQGSILPGITRESVLLLAKNEFGLKVSERAITIDEVLDAHKSGKLNEVFGTGTAAVISPVGELHYKGESYEVGGGKIGELSQRLYDHLTGLQWGKVKDTNGWIVKLDI